jgi:Mrp family chromosome partitioning ATPase
VLVAGAALPPNPGELIETDRRSASAMEALLERAKATYDLIVIDTPSLTAVSDAFPLLKKVDGVVIVGRVGRNRRDVAERLHETLAGAGAPLLGVIANGLEAGRRAGYGYGYGYDYSPAKQPESPEPPAAEPSSGTPVSPDGAPVAAEQPVPTANG